MIEDGHCAKALCLECRPECVGVGLGGATRANRTPNYRSGFESLRIRRPEALRGLCLTFLEDVGNALHVGVEVQKTNAPVDHEQVAALNDPIG